MSGHDGLPDHLDEAKVAAGPACPKCGGPRYHGPFGATCPRCLLAVTADADQVESPQIPGSAAVEALSAVEARRFGHFEIMLRPDGSWWELGRGTTGSTYRALDTDLLMPVALKLVPAARVEQLDSTPILLRDLGEVTKLRHPNIARLIHFGRRADGRGFLAVELAEGETLRDLVQRSGALPVSFVLNVAEQVAQALVAADERGTVHGDLKPANLMLVAAASEARPVVKVMDFGVGHWLNARFAGTRGFASPEQMAGRELDARSDFFALGATLYFLLAASVPEATPTTSKPDEPKRTARIRLSPLREAGVPDEVIAWLRQMLHPSPSRRPKDALDLLDSISALKSRLENSPQSSLSSPGTTSATWWRRLFGPPVA